MIHTMFKNKFLLTSILLLIVGFIGINLTQALDPAYLENAWGAACGETCTSTFNCGGITLPNTCEYDYDISGCTGICGKTCAEGGQNKYCKDTASGTCSTHNHNCTAWLTYTCVEKMYGPPDCTCDETGTNGFCQRLDC